MSVSLNTSLLNRLATTSDKSKLSVMQESGCCSSKKLFNLFLCKSISNPAVRTVLILLQTPEKDFHHIHGLTVCPFFDELCGPNASSLVERIAQFCNSCDRSKANRVFIDSLNPLFQLVDLCQIHSLLSLLTQTCESIVATVFDSALDSKQQALLHRAATAFITLKRGHYDHLLVTTSFKRKHRSLGFKVERKEETVRLMVDKMEVIKESRNVFTNVSKAPADDLPQMTFNLNLNETEKQARDRVQLPYVKTESKIYYVPDERDDVDEEDPDEDLGI